MSLGGYIAGGSIKKPLNQLDNPIQPDIRGTLPRFAWSRKNWKTDVGRALLSSEDNFNSYDYAVLAQPRDYNKTIYGQSSFRQPVNFAFRPPLLTLEDSLPLSRQPRKLTVPRINPQLAGGETSGYTAMNNYYSEVESNLTDRLKNNNARPTFYLPLELPTDNSVLPDLSRKTPAGSTTSGFTIPFVPTNPITTDSIGITMDYQKLQPAGQAGIGPLVTIDAPSGQETLIDLPYTTPRVSAGARYNSSVAIDMETRIPDLPYKRPSVSSSAGYNPSVNVDMESRIPELVNNRPQVSASAGTNMSVEASNIETFINLDYKIPQVSATAGYNSTFKSDAADPREKLNLETKLDDSFGRMTVINPAPKFDGMRYEMPQTDVDAIAYSKRPNYAYTATKDYHYQTENHYSNNMPQIRSKITPKGSNTNQGFIPRKGIDMPQSIALKVDLKKSKVAYHM
jgi:hypothetical protein